MGQKMSYNGFRGSAKRLDNIDLPRIGAQIGVGEDELHAFLEVESRGSGFDALGRPKILFEMHKFYANLPREKRAEAIRQGLASQRWGQLPYGKESEQYSKLERAIKIDEEAALKSCSWGLVQVMGENHLMVGYKTIGDFVRAMMADEENHVQVCVEFLKANHIDDDLRAHRWEIVARVYNGPGYKKNEYHLKLPRAFAKWAKIKDTPFPPARPLTLASINDDPKPVSKPNKTETEAVQKRLRTLGYFMVGKVDGRWGTNTTAAISALQAVAGITVTGELTPETRLALNSDKNRNPISAARASTTVADLREQGSTTIAKADQVGKAAFGVGGCSALGVGYEIVTKWFGEAQSSLSPVMSLMTNVPGEVWAILGLALATYLWYAQHGVKKARLEAERTGLHAGESQPVEGVEEAPQVDFVELAEAA